MPVHSFAGFSGKPSAWGYSEPDSHQASPTQQQQQPPQPSSDQLQYANLPAALLTSLKRDKKPFTYTPGGVNLNEVLSARLQKRLERKKKYQEEVQQQHQLLMVAPTYNSPIDMYSPQNALEALEVQAELVAADKSLGCSRSSTLPRNFRYQEEPLDPSRGVTQSKAFRVLQIITDTEEEPPETSSPRHRDEMRFSGLRESKQIPSRFFQTLQKITGTDGQDDTEENEVRPTRPAPPPQQQQQQQQQQQLHRQPTFSVPKPAFQPDQGLPSFGAPPTLKRPAAFLPIKGSIGFGISNGPTTRKITTAGTDF